MISPQHQRRHAFLQRLHHSFGGACAGLRNLLQITGVLASKCLGLGDFDANVASVGHLVAQRLKPCFQTSDAHR